jgi:hypothetical protein
VLKRIKKKKHKLDPLPKVHCKLSSQESFPFVYKTKTINNESIKNSEEYYYNEPLKATNILKHTLNPDSKFRGRAADFKSEVVWRMQLRPTVQQ